MRRFVRRGLLEVGVELAATAYNLTRMRPPPS